MSRMDTGTRITVKPVSNVYTAMAFISTLSTLAALIYFFLQYKALVGF
jgi:hypothetical protein